MKIIRYTIIFLTLAIIIILLKNCELDPWARNIKTYTFDSKGNSKVINTDMVVVTKTHKQYVINKKIYTWKNNVMPQMASVLFSHNTHSKEDISCSYCHHKNKNPERIKVCAICHFGYNAYKVIHGTCSKCHDMSVQKCSICHTGKK